MTRAIMLVLDPLPSAPTTLAQDLTAALQPGAGFDHTVNIIHYAFAHLLALPNTPPKLLVIAVYDENFADYVTDLVIALTAGFNYAAQHIAGMKELIPIEKNLTAFTDFLLSHDLTNGGGDYFGAFFAAYPYTVNQIHAARDAGFFSTDTLNPA